ncbi:MAG: hypothetical protein KKH94_04380 [Candidatus Omnitrophica bacterium]|nr:hypothetical protein [Candidatus Omnitrophota bacterium]
MKKRDIFYMLIMGVIWLIGFFLWEGVPLSKGPSLEKIREEAAIINNVLVNDIQSLKSTAMILDEPSKIVRRKLLYILFPDRWRGEVEDLVNGNGEKFIFIRNKNDRYQNKRFMMWSGMYLMLYDALAITRPNIVVLEECSFGIRRWKRCFIVSFLFEDLYKIKGYLDYKSFKWEKLEFFLEYPNREWRKSIETNFTEFENIKGVWFPTAATSFRYDYSEGRKQKTVSAWKNISCEVNVDIDKFLFDIPQK